MGIEHIRRFKIGNGLGNVFPIGVLGEDRADHDLEGRIARPPVLRAEVLQEDIIEVAELL